MDQFRRLWNKAFAGLDDDDIYDLLWIAYLVVGLVFLLVGKWVAVIVWFAVGIWLRKVFVDPPFEDK